MITVHALGGFEVRDGELPVPIASKKARALLAYLAVHAGQSVARDRLAALLWEDSNDTQARHSLRQALAALRKALPAADELLTADGESIRLSGDVSLDATMLEQLVRTGHADGLERAVELYRGDFLEGLNARSGSFEDWLMVERTRLREQMLEGTEALLAHLRDKGAIERASRIAVRLVALDPIRESAHRALMELYALLGQHAAALRQYRRCRETLQRVLGVTPEPETDLLYRRILEQRRIAPVATQTALPPAGVSPPPPSSTAETAPRHATVVSIVLADFLMATHRLDAESVHELLMAFRRIVDAAVDNYAGRVIRQDGHTLTAAFGVARAQASDPVRALKAASAIHEQLDALAGVDGPLRARIGVASGQLLVTTTGEAIDTISGAALKFAEHLAVSCPKGEIMVTDAVHSAASHWIEGEPLADFLVHDEAQPTVWRVTSVRSRARNS